MCRVFSFHLMSGQRPITTQIAVGEQVDAAWQVALRANFLAIAEGAV